MFAILVATLAGISLLAWIWLWLGRGGFWQAGGNTDPPDDALDFPAPRPAVNVVVPARNETAALPQTLPALLQQDYRGDFHVWLVDDASDDGTGEVARRLAESCRREERLTVLASEPLPTGWTGKVWAMAQGVRAASERAAETDGAFFLFTDADIVHPPESVRRLVREAVRGRLDLLSWMVALRCESPWERVLIPAFVFFFAKLYPFRWIADPGRGTAGAAGGCTLVRASALAQAGGLERIRGELIDDCALARVIKRAGGRLRLAHSPRETRSVRAYESLGEIWRMVARTAFTQLRYSPVLLAGTLAGMSVLYLVPPLATVFGTLTHDWAVLFFGLASWTLMTALYLPTVRLLRAPAWLALSLPLAGALYAAMTFGSAWQHWRGRGGAWKGRTYAAHENATL